MSLRAKALRSLRAVATYSVGMCCASTCHLEHNATTGTNELAYLLDRQPFVVMAFMARLCPWPAFAAALRFAMLGIRSVTRWGGRGVVRIHAKVPFELFYPRPQFRILSPQLQHQVDQLRLRKSIEDFTRELHDALFGLSHTPLLSATHGHILTKEAYCAEPAT